MKAGESSDNNCSAADDLDGGADDPSVSQLVFTIMERASIRTFSWLKVDMKLGRQHNNHNHKGSAAIKHYANQPTRPL